MMDPILEILHGVLILAMALYMIIAFAIYFSFCQEHNKKHPKIEISIWKLVGVTVITLLWLPAFLWGLGAPWAKNKFRKAPKE